MIRQEDVPLVSVMAAILLAGRIDGIYDTDHSASGAVNIAEHILHKTRERVGVRPNGRQWLVHQNRQSQKHNGRDTSYYGL